MEPIWDELQYGLVDSVCRLDHLIRSLHLVVENVADELVYRSLEEPRAKLESLNELGQINLVSLTISPSSGTHLSPVVRGDESGNSDCACLIDEGEFWTIIWHGMSFCIKNSKGVRLLTVLVENPGRKFHVADLERCERKDEPTEGSSGLKQSNAGPILDASAKRAYKSRLAVLDEQLQEARQSNCIPRESKILEEVAFIMSEMSRASDLYGRNRLAISDVERARVRVTLAVKSAIEKISRYNSSIGDHLASTVRTGIFCLYCPDRVVARDDHGSLRG